MHDLSASHFFKHKRCCVEETMSNWSNDSITLVFFLETNILSVCSRKILCLLSILSHRTWKRYTIKNADLIKCIIFFCFTKDILKWNCLFSHLICTLLSAMLPEVFLTIDFVPSMKVINTGKRQIVSYYYYENSSFYFMVLLKELQRSPWASQTTF